MNILFLTWGDETVASSRTRVFQYVPHLKALGDSCEVLTYRTGLDYRLLAMPTRRAPSKIALFLALKAVSLFHLVYSPVQVLRFCLKARAADLLFIQKVLLPVWVQRYLSGVNPRIVFDYDDALYADEKSYDRERFDAQLRNSRLVVLENENTEAYAKPFGVPCLRITGPIDCSRYRPRPAGARTGYEVVIGWIGSRSTTEFLAKLARPLAELCAKYPQVVCEWIGAGELEMPGVRARSVAWSLVSEVESLARFDIGVMPLVDNAFTRGKGGYKILQYMAMGIPSVASPVGVNNEIVVSGETGFICRDEEWFGVLDRLVAEASLRGSLGQAARRRAEQLYSFEASTVKLRQSFLQLLQQ